ncbi:MAG: hypothetical protein KGL38_12275, partial [Gemmatimonadota bacterium]|nr:hypothetical protein [Gemmatimonadota bacterium]
MAIPVAVRAADFAALDTPLLAVALEAGAALPPALAPVDAATNGALGRALAARDFRAGRDELLYLAGSATGV